MLKDLSDIARTFETQYASKTPKLIKVRRRREIGPNDFALVAREGSDNRFASQIVDCFILYAVTVAALQYTYLCLFGSFPYNAFLGGLFCSLGFAVLTICFRMQIDPTTLSDPDRKANLEKVFADYCVACVFLFFVAISYVG